MQVTDEMVDRFLSWRLPITAMPDACVMDRSHDRQGTNVLSFTEAKAMLEHVLSSCDDSKSWHSGPPKEPGWYWTMWRGCRGPEAVKVIYTDRPELPGQVWYGPITVPPWLEHHPGDLPSEPPKPVPSDIVFRCCSECGSAENVRAETTRCPGCGTPYPHSSAGSSENG